MPLSRSHHRDFRGTERFQIQRTIGAGGMGIVYEALDRVQGTRIAVKTLRNLEPQALYRLKREFRALQDLHHPNLVELGELIEASGQWFFTMELVEGVDFLSWVREVHDPAVAATASWGCDETIPTILLPDEPTADDLEKAGQNLRVSPRFNEQKLRSAMVQLGLGLNALHATGKIHRDIKPSNLKVTADGRLVVLDFGLIREEPDKHDSADRHVVGTAAYMAPEQAASRPLGPEADWYSVGVLLYQVLTGQLPFTGRSLEVLLRKQQYEPPAAKELAPNIPDELADLCSDLLRFDPTERPSGPEVLTRLGLPGVAEGNHPSYSSAGYRSSTSTAPFVGRTEELQQLHTAFEAARTGTGVTMFVRGESGVGKSATIRQFARSLRADAEDAVVLAGRCYERESVPYKAFDGVIDALSQHMRRLSKEAAAGLLPRNAALLPQVFPVLGRVDAIAEAPRPITEVRDPRELRNRLFAALRELFARMSDTAPLLIVIDDLQWADTDSLLLLAEVMRPPEAPGLLLIASVRETERTSTVTGSVTGDVRTIHLDRLPPEESRQLAAQLLARLGDDAPSHADAIAAEAAGHPLFIDELVRHAQEDAAPISGELRLDDVIWARVQRMEPVAIRMLELVALAGTPLPQEVIRVAAELEPTDAARQLSVLRAASLVRTTGNRGDDELEPYHNRIRESVIAHMTEEQRRHCHERLASALETPEAADQPPEIVVRHLEAAGRIEAATRRAEQAARRAALALAFERAADLYRTALRLGDYAEEPRRRLLGRLGDALANAGRGADAADAYLAAAEHAEPSRGLEFQRRAAEQLLVSGHVDRGLATMRGVLAEVGVRLPKTGLRSLTSFLWTYTKLRVRGLRWTERSEQEVPAGLLMRLDVYKTVAHGLTFVDTIRGVDFQARALLLALKAGERKHISRSMTEVAGFVAAQGRRGPTRARKLLDTARGIAERSGDPYLLALTTTVDGVVRYYSGRFHSAAEQLDHAEHLLLEQTVGSLFELNTTRLFRLLSLRRVGAYNELTRSMERYLRDAIAHGNLYAEVSFRRLFNDIWLARDDVAEAARDLSECSWPSPEVRFHIQHWYELRAQTELALYQAHGTEALELLAQGNSGLRQSRLLAVQDVRTDWYWARGRAAIVAAISTGHTTHCKLALRQVKLLAREHAGFASAYAHILRAGVATVTGNPKAALGHLRDAESEAENSDLPLCAAAARRQRGALLGGDTGAQLIANADRWMLDHGIANPTRMTATLCSIALPEQASPR